MTTGIIEHATRFPCRSLIVTQQHGNPDDDTANAGIRVTFYGRFDHPTGGVDAASSSRGQPREQPGLSIVRVEAVLQRRERVT